jgi:YVTN family beta-propeller protein
MAFTLYPRPAGRALRIAKAPSDRVETAFDPITGPAPAGLGADLSQAMFIRLAVLTGATAPVLSLRCDTGASVVLTAQRQAVFASPGQKDFVGEARVVADADGTFVITVGLITAQPHAWSLGVLNTDTTDQDYTWVVADTLAATDQPWIRSNAYDYTPTPVGKTTGDEPAQLVLAVDPISHTTYASQTFQTIAWMFGNGSAAGTVSLPGPALQCAVDAATQSLWLSAFGPLYVRTGNDFVAVDGVQTGAGIAIDPIRRRGYVTLYDEDKMAVVDADSRTVLDTIPVGHQPIVVAVDAASGVIAVAGSDSNVTIVAPDQPTFTVAAGSPASIAVGPGGTTVYTANAAQPTLSVIDVSSRSVTTVTTGSKPPSGAFEVRALAVDPQRFLLYFAQGPRVMDTRTGVLTEIIVPDVPEKVRAAITVDDNDHTVMVSFDSNIYSLTPTPK